MRANCGDNNPSQNPDPQTARTSPTWDNNPNHKPDPMKLFDIESAINLRNSNLLSLHHQAAYDAQNALNAPHNLTPLQSLTWTTVAPVTDPNTVADSNANPTPTPVVDPNANPTPTPVVDQNVTPTPTPVVDPNANPTPTPVVDPNVTPTPTPTPQPVVIPVPTVPPMAPADFTLPMNVFTPVDAMIMPTSMPPCWTCDIYAKGTWANTTLQADCLATCDKTKLAIPMNCNYCFLEGSKHNNEDALIN